MKHLLGTIRALTRCVRGRHIINNYRLLTIIGAFCAPALRFHLKHCACRAVFSLTHQQRPSIMPRAPDAPWKHLAFLRTPGGPLILTGGFGWGGGTSLQRPASRCAWPPPRQDLLFCAQAPSNLMLDPDRCLTQKLLGRPEGQLVLDAPPVRIDGLGAQRERLRVLASRALPPLKSEAVCGKQGVRPEASVPKQLASSTNGPGAEEALRLLGRKGLPGEVQVGPCLALPRRFVAVGPCYADFSPVADETVIALLTKGIAGKNSPGHTGRPSAPLNRPSAKTSRRL